MSNPVGIWLKSAVVRKTGTNAGFAEMKRLYTAWYLQSFDSEPNTKNFQDMLQQNSMTVEVLRKKSCMSWTSSYDTKTAKYSRVTKRTSMQPSVLDVELVDVEADCAAGVGNEDGI